MYGESFLIIKEPSGVLLMYLSLRLYLQLFSTCIQSDIEVIVVYKTLVYCDINATFYNIT